jgi:ABC-type branched-subunit amino acid transport system substrate-binding protein
MASVRGGSTWKGAALFVAGVLFGVLAAYQIVPASKAGNVNPQAFGTGPGVPVLPNGSPLPSTGPNPTGTTPAGGSTSIPNPKGLQCARGSNGGTTDKGVTGTTIKLATTVVRTGIGAAFLGEVQFAMDAMKNKVNRTGGICGRLLDIRYVDDAWRADLGQKDIRDFIDAGYFAIPVGPSSEGLNGAIQAGVIREAGMPVIGTDGMVISQYTDPWVWPVAVSTASSARIMADQAKKLGAKSFSIVFDKDYKFGKEAAYAFNAEVKRLTGSDVPGFNRDLSCQQSFCGVIANQTSYGGEVSRFKPGDIVAMFLEPATALRWMPTSGAPTPKTVKAAGGVGVWGAQPLFTYDFEVKCQDACDGMWVWSGFKPPREQYALDPAVKTYVSDLHKTKDSADEFNAFSEGGYVGMQLLVAAMQKVGPNLTRANLRLALDSMDFSSPLTLQPTLTWRPGSHFSNATMQAWEIEYKGSPAFWRAEAIAQDPNPAQTARDAK